jgi:hypothetical protein
MTTQHRSLAFSLRADDGFSTIAKCRARFAMSERDALTWRDRLEAEIHRGDRVFSTRELLSARIRHGQCEMTPEMKRVEERMREMKVYVCFDSPIERAKLREERRRDQVPRDVFHFATNLP